MSRDSGAPSMGPRSDERGNEFRGIILRERKGSLQWGRAQMSAEIQPRIRQLISAASLQWGRAQMSAEMFVLLVPVKRAGLPSMGPRSDERGNFHSGCVGSWGSGFLQWGRAQMSAEIVFRTGAK